jgi:hypothetical protein
MTEPKGKYICVLYQVNFDSVTEDGDGVYVRISSGGDSPNLALVFDEMEKPKYVN